MRSSSATAPTETAAANAGTGRFTMAGVLALPVIAWWLTRTAVPWAAMWAIAGAEFLALKLVTLRSQWRAAPLWLTACYVTAWPGMNASAFLRGRNRERPRPAPGQLAFAIGAAIVGLLAVAGVAWFSDPSQQIVAAWTGMVGIILVLHFGSLSAISWLWRRAGFDAPPIMRAPLLATSLADFWSARWNIAFADCARRFVFRPFARRWGTTVAGACVFLVSGLIHESVISLPARGGWGGPTLYFVLQAAGIAFERSELGRKNLGLAKGVRGRVWTLLITATPVPLLFHPPFVERVIVPFLSLLKPLNPFVA